MEHFMIELLAGLSIFLFGTAMLVVARKLGHLIRVNAESRRLLRHDSGINIVHGIGGNQTGRVLADKRISTDSVRSL